MQITRCHIRNLLKHTLLYLEWQFHYKFLNKREISYMQMRFYSNNAAKRSICTTNIYETPSLLRQPTLCGSYRSVAVIPTFY